MLGVVIMAHMETKLAQSPNKVVDGHVIYSTHGNTNRRKSENPAPYCKDTFNQVLFFFGRSPRLPRPVH